MLYAGIGSRETPPNELLLMNRLARHFGAKGYKLRTGGARGADTAFASGALAATFDHEAACSPIIYTPNSDLPWQTLMNHAHDFHPNWPALQNKGDYVMKLMARNSAILLGPTLDEPVDFIVCWTPGGLPIGGTGQALRIAKHLNLPVYNLHNHTYNFEEDRWLLKQMALPL